VNLFRQGIQDADGVPCSDQCLDQMMTDETGSPSDQDVHLSCHRGADAFIAATPP